MRDKKKLKSGIYKITNTINNKIYIGMSTNIKSRWSVHRNDLKNNKHHSFHLQRAYNKYGLSNFKFEILEYYPEENLELIEQAWLNFYKSYDRKLGYNIELGCKKISKETREKMRIRGLRKERMEWLSFISKNRKLKKIYQYDLYGNFIKEWTNTVEVVNFYNCDRSHLNKACRKKALCKGYQWRYEQDVLTKDNINPYKSLNLKLLSYELENEKIIFIGSKEASIYFNKDITTIQKWLCGKLKFTPKGKLTQIL